MTRSRLGLVSSLDKPGGNVTGVNIFLQVLGGKRLGLLRELIPNAGVIGVLLYPNARDIETQLNDIRAAAQAIDQRILVLNVATEQDVHGAFRTLAQARAGALLFGNHPFFTSRKEQFITLAAHYAIPAIYGLREEAVAGGLMSYGTEPAPMPIVSPASTPAEFSRAKSQPICRSCSRPSSNSSINLKTAKALGLTCRPAARPRRRGDRMRRREFIAAARRRGGVAARGARAAARAHAADRRADEPGGGRSGGAARIAAFQQGLQQAGLDRWPQCADRHSLGAGDADRIRRSRRGIGRACAGRHLGLRQHRGVRCCRQPAPCRSCSRRSPIRSALALSRAWRGRAATSPASLSFEYGISAKWLELLKEIAPGVTRACGSSRSRAVPAGIGQFAVIQAVAPSLGVNVSPVNVRDAPEIERAVAAFARSANGGLIVTASASAMVHRDLIIALAARHKLPAVYPTASTSPPAA